MRAVSKQEAVPKKVARKTVSRAVTAVSKKAPAKKKVVEKATTPARKVRTVKTKLKEEKTLPEKEVETVFVPGAASLRLLEKAEIYRVWYKNNFPLQVAGVAKVAGYAFILLGTVLASAAYLTNNTASDYKAAVVCSNSICNEVADADLPVSAPLITFKNSLPDNLKSDTDILIKVENTSVFKVYIKNLATNERTELAHIESLEGGEYRYLISAQDRTNGAHQLVAEAETDEALYKFLGPQFKTEKIVQLPEIEEFQPVTPVETLSTTIIEDEEESIESEGDVLVEEEATTTEAVNEAPGDEETELIEETKEEEIEETVVEKAPIVASVEGEQDAQYLRIKTGTILPETVHVYSEVASSGQPLYLGQATLVQGEWIFSLTALQLPSVTHFLYASFIVDGILYQSTGASFRPVYAEAGSQGSDISLLVQKVELALLDKETTYNRAQYFSAVTGTTSTLFERNNEIQLADDELLDTLDEYLTLETDTLNNLFAKYAEVTQVGQKYLITLADNMLVRQAGVLSRQIADDINERSAVPALQTVLSLRYQKLKELISQEENKLNLETSSLTSRDSDSDGISDFDEITMHTTSPLSADSDMDGAIDSIEVLTGSNPLESDLLTVVSAGHISEDITYDEVVTITLVEPLIVRSREYATEAVHALVHGKSIPNSYVHIVSSSMNTVGVIKTNATGDFSYTLEQALPDKRHEIVAVIADTAGNVVASSKPHTFTKTESSFVAAAAGSQNVFFGTDEARVAIQFSTITTAIGVVALGLVLLLLTHTLRTRKGHFIKEKQAT